VHKSGASRLAVPTPSETALGYDSEFPFSAWVSLWIDSAGRLNVNDYDPIAEVFDDVMGTDFHAATHQLRRHVLQEHFHGQELVCLDLCCGTGIFFSLLAKDWSIRGLGIDLSSRQVDVARARAQSHSSHLQYENGDVTRTGYPERVDLVTINFDALNHLRSAELWKQTFAKAYASLKRGGGLLFDINLLQRLQGDWNKPEIIIKKHLMYIQVAFPPVYNSDGIIRRTHMLVFSRMDCGAFRRVDAVVEHLAMPVDRVFSLLDNAGFREARIVEAYRNEPRGHIFNKNRAFLFAIK